MTAPTMYAKTRAAAINNADRAVSEAAIRYHGGYAETLAYRNALVSAHHTILELEAGIDRMRAALETGRSQQ